MATLQHLRVPWLWHLMDDVPVALCRLYGPAGRAAPARGRPPARRPVPGLLAAAGRRDRGGRGPAPARRRGRAQLGGRRAPRAPGPTSTGRARPSGSCGRPDQPEQGGRPPHRGRRQAPRPGLRGTSRSTSTATPTTPTSRPWPGSGGWRGTSPSRGRGPRRSWPGSTRATTSSPSRPGTASRSPSPRWRPPGGAASR